MLLGFVGLRSTMARVISVRPEDSSVSGSSFLMNDVTPGCDTSYWTDILGAHVSFSFVGTSVSVIGSTSSYGGVYEVYLDDVSMGFFDRYTDPANAQCGIETVHLSNLSPGVQHTLQMIFIGDSMGTPLGTSGVMDFSEFRNYFARYEVPDAIDIEIQEASFTDHNNPTEVVDPEVQSTRTPTDEPRREVQTSTRASGSTARASQSKRKTSSLGPIIGGVAGGIAGLVFFVTLVWVLVRRVKKREAQKVDLESGDDDGKGGIGPNVPTLASRTNGGPTTYTNIPPPIYSPYDSHNTASYPSTTHERDPFRRSMNAGSTLNSTSSLNAANYGQYPYSPAPLTGSASVSDTNLLSPSPKYTWR
ncbi:hypothetical protein FRC02_009716 [Tulasnella sp. 418]|nr:hypothetical protein FRC02_009716 [Tulasnella sp. 418]